MVYIFVHFLHVAIAIFAMGPHIAGWLILGRIRRKPELYQSLGQAVDLVLGLPRYGGPLMVLTGLILAWMSSSGISLILEPWLLISIILFLGTILYGQLSARKPRQSLQEMEARGQFSAPTVVSATSQLERVTATLGLAVLAVLLLMVYRPEF